MQQITTAHCELRHLSAGHRRNLEQLLDSADNWKQLISVLPKQLLEPPSEQQLKELSTLVPWSPAPLQPNQCAAAAQNPLISASTYTLLEQQKYAGGNGGSPSKALLDYWSTYGRRRPTVAHLVHFLRQAKLFRVAQHVLQQILNLPLLPELVAKNQADVAPNSPIASNNTRPSSEITTEPSQILDIDLIQLNSKKIDLSTTAKTEISDICTKIAPHASLDAQPLHEFDYDQLVVGSNNFDETPAKEGGRKLGEGGFGSVYLAHLKVGQTSSQPILAAVKRLRNEFSNQLGNELRVLSQFRHVRLLRLIGVCRAIDGNDSPACLVYEYMSNGCLLDRLRDRHPALQTTVRLRIAHEIAEGLSFLHEQRPQPLVHRDVKSANVLLDQHFQVRIGDFGLARLARPEEQQSTHTCNVIGTSVYMAPEAFKGDVSIKLDTFSFGVILLELLTGLPPFDASRECGDLLAHVNDLLFDASDDEEEQAEPSKDEIKSNDKEQITSIRIQRVRRLLDQAAGEWNLKTAENLFNVAQVATHERKRKRPTMVQVLQMLDQMNNF